MHYQETNKNHDTTPLPSPPPTLQSGFINQTSHTILYDSVRCGEWRRLIIYLRHRIKFNNQHWQ